MTSLTHTRFTPKHGQPYWTRIGREAMCFVWKGDHADQQNHASYNCFQTKREVLNRINPEPVQETTT